MEIVNKGENTNYSFDLFLDDMPEYEFYSLVVSKTEDGTIEEPYVIGYKMTEEDYETYLAHDMDFKYFKAIQRFYTFDSFFTDTQKGMTGRSGDCGENTIEGGGSNNGGGGGGATAPGETFTFNYNGTIANTTFGLRQNANLYNYNVTIIDNNGESTSTTNGSSTSIGVSTTANGVTGVNNEFSLAGSDWSNLIIDVSDSGSGNGGLPCYKLIRTGDNIYWIQIDCPTTNQLKRGSTSRSSTTLSDCFVTSGGVGINVTLLAVDINRMLNGALNDDQLAFLTSHHENTIQVFKFLNFNKTAEDRAFAIRAIETMRNGGEVDFVDHLKDYDFHVETPEVLDFEQDFRNRMSNAEKVIFDGLSRLQQLDYLHSAYLAQTYATIYYLDNIKIQYNGKGDAYRHTLWNALATAKLGEILAKQLTDAHEIPDVGQINNQLEKSMDLHNNEVGRQIGKNSIFMLMMKVNFAVEKGDTNYITPTNSNGSVINGVSQIKPTNQ